MIALRPISNEKPVLALAFVDNWLAAGVGTFVRLYCWRRGELADEVQAFLTNRVHGLVPLSSTTLLAWGGTSCTTLEIRGNKLFVSPETRLPDWIVTCSAKNGIVYALTAHNEVRELDYTCRDLDRVHKCGEASLLYSGKVFLNGTKRLVAAGTVLRGIVVWDLQTDEVVRVFDVHKGVVFDIEFSASGNHLVSCSDDRSVCLLNLATGATKSGFAHASRVWRVRFFGSKIISTGEDCTARVWEAQGGKLVARRVLCAHSGRNVWSVALQGPVAATGGADSRIVLWDLDARCTVEDFDEQVFSARVRSIAVNSEGITAISTLDGLVYTLNTHWVKRPVVLGGAAKIKACGSEFYALTAAGDGVWLANNESRPFSLVPVVDFFPVKSGVLVVQSRDSVFVYDIKTGEQNPVEFECQVTAACMYGQYLLLGTRRGDLLLTDGVNTSTNMRAFECASPITSLNILGSTVLATSLGGHVGSFLLPSLTRLSSRRARKRGSVETANGDIDNLLFCGFQNTSLVAWDGDGAERAVFPCGGKHRVYGHAFVDKDLVFSFVRAQHVFVARIATHSPYFAKTVLSSGTHGREIRCAESSPVNNKIIALGSEDTAVSIARLSGNHVQTECILRGHISAVQCLHWTQDGRFLLSGGGMGEIIAWEVRSVDNKLYANRIERTPQTESKTTSALRVMAFSIHGDLVAAAYSDSSLRIWRMEVDLDSNGTTLAWTLLCAHRYAECCLLHIDFTAAFGKLLLLITATDGSMAVYETQVGTQADVELVLRVRVHQSSIRAARFVHNVTDDEIWCYTAGDDNALHATRLHAQRGQVVATPVFCEPNAHTAALTALVVDCDHNLVITAGSDQRVRFWDMKTGAMVASVTTDVCDTGVLVQIGDKLGVAGIGVAIYEMDCLPRPAPAFE